MPTNEIKVRRSVRGLQAEYDKGNKQPLEDLVRAWRGIQNLPATDKRSFFAIGGYHGEPFQYRRQVDNLSDTDRYTYWGGYCNHGNVLFPTWHRVYVRKLEEALQSIVPSVTMPYWDETSDESRQHGIPSILTQEQFPLDGELIDNPLRSFILPEALSDYLPGDDRIYEKPKGYETVRYPLSGLVGTEAARAATDAHNAQYPHPSENIKLLNQNIVDWLEGPKPEEPKPRSQNGVYWEFQNCLHAPNYTVFSNTTSAGQWNLDRSGTAITPLESPHNDIHLAVGGFDVPGQGEAGKFAGANGDMGENNTAAMDPIFFFHHCNVDRMFWLWQKQNGFTDSFEIISGYAGTSSSDSQGPTPGIAPGTPLDLDTPLNPFLKDEFGTIFTSRDCINIEKQLGYTYAPGSLEVAPELKAVESGFSTKKLTVRGIDRALFQGSFVLRAYATVQNEKGESTEYYLGHHSVLSRRNVIRCANCLTHLEVIAHFPLGNMPAEAVERAKFRLEIQHRGAELPAKLNYTLEVND
ncbi:tyrosinase family protein [Pseudanabaena sp. PCC 6802]|uniref:tyrosinase family protein n=1 Tax=Pseudanabaena sp. PCC 6802 TaxID=118173 RepID=UPI000348E845|nr:tyrosinase family protein [Pseudanabaena sp. PCC 6802]